MAGQDSEKPEPKPKPDAGKVDTPEESLRGLARAFRLFLLPFLFSWALAYVGSARGVEWLYFAGLGGVTLSMLAFLVWLIS